MLQSLLPRRADNTFRGRKAALWLFGLLLLVRSIMGFNSMINTRSVASTADGIPFERFGPEAEATAVALFALNGFGRLTLAVLGLVVLLRYRALIPFMFAFFLVEQLSRSLLLRLIPIPRAGTPPASAMSAAPAMTSQG